MTETVIGSPLETFASAVLTHLLAGRELSAAVGARIKASLPETKGVPKPYIVGARRELVQTEGVIVTCGVWLDFWSELNGPHEVHVLMSMARLRLQRQNLDLGPYRPVAHSLKCEEETALPDFDPDAPAKRLYRGMQKWVCRIEEHV